MSFEPWMERALALAARGAGEVEPNPRVGCVLLQGEQVVGELFPPVVLGDFPARRLAVATRVIAQQPGPAEPPAEVEIEHTIARAAGGESVQLDDGVATFVAEFDRKFGAGNCESRHQATLSVTDRLAVESFYPEVSITFVVRAAGEHYHVPLLLNPFGFTTYRGS